MPSNEEFRLEAFDPVLEQAEKILAQRQSRALVIDPDLLGEPGWDILLCAFIAHRRGLVCKLREVASEIGLGISTAKRWIDLLSLRDMLIQKGDFFVISEDTERKLATMFKLQIKQAIESISAFEGARERSALGRI